MEKKYWQSIEETQADYKPKAEEKETSMIEILANESNEKAASRRDFLKWCGISFFSATVISACENPVKKAIPYLHQPETLTPGKANWYASSFVDGNRFCSVLVKTRDGRPIKIEGNDLCTFTGGGTNAIVQASVLSLYDDGARYKHPTRNNEKISWDMADESIKKTLAEAAGKGKKCYLLTPTLLSRSTVNIIESLKDKYPALEFVSWDAVGYDAIREAHRSTFQTAAIPDYRFDKADLIVSFSADFLATWLAPVSFAQRYTKTRRVSADKQNMSRHIHFEAGMSVTGSNADERIPVKPSIEMEIIMELYNEMAAITGNPVFSSPATDYDTQSLAQEILTHKGKAIIVCGHDNLQAQILINAINQMAESYGNTLDNQKTLNMGRGNKDAMNQMIQDMEAGNAEMVMFYKSNPLYNHPEAGRIKAAMANVPVTVSFATAKDETARECNYILPDNHYLESWGEVMPAWGTNALMQPAMQPIFNTRQFQSSLLAWMEEDTDYHKHIMNYAERVLFPRQNQFPDFQQFWIHTLQAGILENDEVMSFNPTLQQGVTSEAIASLKNQVTAAGDIQFMTHETVSMGDGSYANNPWLQELPDPVTKISWDNFAAVSPKFAEDHNLKDGNLLVVNGMEVPMIVQPGQAYGCISLALGYGREYAGKSADKIGANTFRLLNNEPFPWNVNTWSNKGGAYEFARSQTHHSMEGRHIVRESSLDKYKENPKAGNEIRDYHLKHMVTLYPEQKFEGHHWVLMVDLNACSGCSTCVIACQAENNVPVVGKDEVRRRRIMHWMRIDRYYTGEAENPGVVYQPLMCQHCDNAPCENVCPVAATTHSGEGINQIAYNRCVGTKYCINNCPYKVRRFNWFRYANNDRFDYNMNSDLGRMVLNPDVTVRERGVVEKCSFCIQRIQEGKLKAKNERRKLKDGDITPACAGACPSQALVFGDLNDPDSRVAQLIKDPRNYHLLEELHTLPTVGYMTKIRNKGKG
ncbi:MAG: 4Fe-4S dicluster domain-containing protein [Bacteroidetes bacterium]|nr:MAG: 4Fe-4S dicluster domain-containing protein [Bacteroidota bacterium]